MCTGDRMAFSVEGIVGLALGSPLVIAIVVLIIINARYL